MNIKYLLIIGLYIFFSPVSYSQNSIAPEGNLLSFLYDFKPFVVPEMKKLDTYNVSKQAANISKIEGALKENKPIKVIYNDGTVFEGTLYKNYKDYILNEGNLVFANGDSYKGSFGSVYSEPYTQGVYRFKDATLVTITTEKKEAPIYSLTTRDYKMTDGASFMIDNYYMRNIYTNAKGYKFSYYLNKEKKLNSHAYFNYPNGILLYGKYNNGVPDGIWSISKNSNGINTLCFKNGQVTGCISNKFPEESDLYYFYYENKLLNTKATYAGAYYYCVNGDCLNGTGELFYSSTNENKPLFLFTKATFNNKNSVSEAHSVFYNGQLEVIKYLKGPLVDYEFHGKCHEVYADGSPCFVGEMNMGNRAKGYYFYENYGTFEGDFKDHYPSFGKITLPGLGYYEGNCNSEGMKGTGKFYFADGSTVKSDNFQKYSAAAATYTLKNGQSEVGIYHFDKNTFEYVDYLGQMKAYIKSLEQANKPQIATTTTTRSSGQCGTCHGSGAVVITCSMCKGNGKSETWVKVNDYGRYSGKGTCIYCRGIGTMSLSNSCRSCNGSGKN